MMLVLNDTPFATGGAPLIDKNGLQHWVVMIKATYSLFPDGTTQLAPEQLPTLLVGEPRDPASAVSSLRYEADLVLDKPFADVLVNGSAHAPGGAPATEVTVGLKVATVKKTLKVKGDRVYQKTVAGKVAPSAALPFERMPVIYERAYGGTAMTDPDVRTHRLFQPNPIGCGLASTPEDLLDTPAPNVLFSDAPMRDDEAAGFGPLCGHWVPRSRFVGTYDQAWIENHSPLLPLDSDLRWYQCAPADQQVEPASLGGARAVLTNMTPAGRLEVTIPRHAFSLRTVFGGYPRRKSVTHGAKLHTVIIEPDEQRLVVVWHSHLGLGRAVDDIDHTIVLEGEGAHG